MREGCNTLQNRSFMLFEGKLFRFGCKPLAYTEQWSVTLAQFCVHLTTCWGLWALHSPAIHGSC